MEFNNVITTSLYQYAEQVKVQLASKIVLDGYCISTNVLVNFHLSGWFLLISLPMTFNNLEFESRSFMLNSLLRYHDNSESGSHTETSSQEMKIITLLLYKHLNVTLEMFSSMGIRIFSVAV